MLKMNHMYILVRTTHCGIQKGTKWARFLDLSNRPTTVTALTWMTRLLELPAVKMETSSVALRIPANSQED